MTCFNCIVFFTNASLPTLGECYGSGWNRNTCAFSRVSFHGYYSFFYCYKCFLHVMQKKGYSMYPGLRQATISDTHVILAIKCYVNRPTLKVINVYLVNVSFFNFYEHCFHLQ